MQIKFRNNPQCLGVLETYDCNTLGRVLWMVSGSGQWTRKFNEAVMRLIHIAMQETLMASPNVTWLVSSIAGPCVVICL